MPNLTRRAFLLGTVAVVGGAAVVAAGVRAAAETPVPAPVKPVDDIGDGWSFNTLSIVAGATVALGHWEITLSEDAAAA